MKDATARNDIQVSQVSQVIQKVLEEFLGNRKAAKVAEEISATMREETQHNHKGEVFYIHKDEDGALVLTMESTVDDRMLEILSSHLEEDEVQECMEMIRAGILGETKNNAENAEFETIKVEGSESKVYVPLMEHKAANRREEEFQMALKEAISASVQNFRVYVCDDPPIDESDKLQFVAGFKPAVGYSYDELEGLAESNGLRLGDKFEYVLFIGTLINNLIAEGWSEADAWFSVCCESKKLGHYNDSSGELTGSRKIAGKCDLANTIKFLEKEKETRGFQLAGGNFNNGSSSNPLAGLLFISLCDGYRHGSVGWFVL